MSDRNDIRDLFKIPRSTAEVMRENIKHLEGLSEVQEKLKSLGIADDKTLKQITDLKNLTQSILENFDIDEGVL